MSDAILEPEVLEAEVIATDTALTVTTGRAVDLWTDTASTFIPTLKADMTPDERREAVREVASKAVAVDDRLNLVLGELLYESSQNSYWKEWENPVTGNKFSTFEEYCEDELDLKKSKAHYLKAIYKVFVIDLDLPLEKLRELEWSKAKELRHVITPENADDLIDKIKKMSVKDVKAMVQAMQGKTPATSAVTKPVADDKVRIVFKASPEQAENIKAALGVAESMTTSDVPSNNLDLICTDFLGSAAGTGLSGVMGSLDVLVKNIERSFGVNISVTGHDEERYGKLAQEAKEEEGEVASDTATAAAAEGPDAQ